MSARRRPQVPLTLTAPGGPPGWPLGSKLSFDDACRVLGGPAGGKTWIVAFDQARRTGWCAHDGRQPGAHGVAGDTLDCQVVLDRLEALPGFSWDRTLVAFEDHREINKRQRWSADGRPERNPVDVALGLGDARGGWRVLLDLRGHPKSQRILVHPSAWREVLKGMKFGGGDDWKSAAMRFAGALTSQALADDNEAEAIAMACWVVGKGLHAWATERLVERADARERDRASRRPA